MYFDYARLAVNITMAFWWMVIDVQAMISKPEARLDGCLGIISGLLVLALFMVQLILSFLSETTNEILFANTETTNYNNVASVYKTKGEIDAIALILLAILMTKYASLSQAIAKLSGVILSILSHLMPLLCMWYISVYLFALVANNMYCWEKAQFRNLSLSMMELLGSIVMNSTSSVLTFDDVEVSTQIRTFIYIIMTYMTIKLLIVSQISAMYIEQMRRLAIMQKTLYETYPELVLKNIGRDWLKHSLDCCKRTKKTSNVPSKNKKKQKKHR